MIKNAKIALTSIMANKFRAILTTLGIIFGVAAVISMLAIGNGAQQKILEQLVQEMEQWNYKRLLLMKDLADHWDTNLAEIPKRLKIKPRKRVYAQ